MFVFDKPFQPSLMFFSKAGAYFIGEPFKCSTLGQAPEAVFLVVCDPSMNDRPVHRSIWV